MPIVGDNPPPHLCGTEPTAFFVSYKGQPIFILADKRGAEPIRRDTVRQLPTGFIERVVVPIQVPSDIYLVASGIPQHNRIAEGTQKVDFRSKLFDFLLGSAP